MSEKENVYYVANCDEYKYAAEEHRRQDNQSKRMVSIHGSNVPFNVKVSKISSMFVYNKGKSKASVKIKHHNQGLTDD